MFDEYREWCHDHPDATEQEKKEFYDHCVRIHEIQNAVRQILYFYSCH